MTDVTTTITGTIGPDGDLRIESQSGELPPEFGGELPPALHAEIQKAARAQAVELFLQRQGKLYADNILEGIAADEAGTSKRINDLINFMNASGWTLHQQMFVLAHQVAMMCMVPLELVNDRGEPAPRKIQAQVNASAMGTLIAQGISGLLVEEHEGGQPVVHVDNIGSPQGNA